MATATEVETYELPLFRRTSWGAIWAGFFTGFGVWFLLLSLIAAIGLSDLNPANMRSMGSAGTGFGVWGAIAGIIAVFCGAFVAGRLAGTRSGWEGALHGVTVWAFILVATFWLAGMAASAALGQAGQAGGTTGAGPSQQAIRAASAGAWGIFIASALMFLAGLFGGLLSVAGFRTNVPVPERTPLPRRPLTPQEA